METRVFCARCGGPLEVTEVDGVVYAHPCELCCEASWVRGYHDGLQDGSNRMRRFYDERSEGEVGGEGSGSTPAID